LKKPLGKKKGQRHRQGVKSQGSIAEETSPGERGFKNPRGIKKPPYKYWGRGGIPHGGIILRGEKRAENPV